VRNKTDKISRSTISPNLIATPTANVGANLQENKVGLAQKEVGGRDGPDPTRFGDWEKSGRCIDF
jgi:hypothetical protein